MAADRRLVLHNCFAGPENGNGGLYTVITFGESTLPDHVVEFTIDKFIIENDLLMG